MALLDPSEREELVEMIAQAVVDRIEERERVSRLADLVVARVLALQAADTSLGTPSSKKVPSSPDNS